MTRTRRYTTRREDAAFLLELLSDASRAWKVGDECLGQGENSRVASIDGERVTLENGQTFHVSRMRRPSPKLPAAK